MKQKSIDTIVSQWKKGYNIKTKATGMGSGSHTWRPIIEDGEIVKISVYGSGQGWYDQIETFHSLETATELLRKEEKQDVSLD